MRKACFDSSEDEVSEIVRDAKLYSQDVPSEHSLEEINEIVADEKAWPQGQSYGRLLRNSQLANPLVEKSRVNRSKPIWVFFQLIAVILSMFLSSAWLHMTFSETEAEIVFSGRIVPRHLQGCGTISYATRYGQGQCSRFESKSQNPFFYSLCTGANLAIWWFLFFSSRPNRGLRYAPSSPQ